MAATACAYAYQGVRPPPPPLMPAARSSPQVVPEPPFEIDDRAALPVPPLPPPSPQLQRSLKAPPDLFSRHPGLCTEGLGSESSGDVDLDDNLIDDVQDEPAMQCKREQRDSDDEPARTRSRRAFPPPISVIGAGGKPWLHLRPYRADGRLVLREVRIPSQELLQARREDGRFKLNFTQPQPEEEEQLVEVPQCLEQERTDAMVKEQDVNE